MKRLYAPWREKYTLATAQSNDKQLSKEECIFCEQFGQNKDETYLILKRLKNTIIMLNKYPYNPGHILILPINHVARLDELSQESRAELMEQITICCSLVTTVLKAHGINVGLNLGKAAGAGLPSHLHMHVLPRYNGDTNFLPTLGDTKQISIDLQVIFKQLKTGLESE